MKDMTLRNLPCFEPASMTHPLNIVWKKAKCDYVIDIYNKKYIDFTSTIFVMNIGHSNKRVKKYLHKQLNKNLFHTYMFASKIKIDFLSKLIRFTPDFCEKAFLLSSGTEATEASVKLMRSYKKGKKVIVSIKGAMHGRTMAAELMKGSGYYKHPEFKQLSFPNTKSVFLKDFNKLKIDKKKIGGFMIETYQGWSAKFLPKKYIKDLVEFANKNKILVCFDEIQSGFARTGKLFGFEHYDVVPDLICVGKGMGGGLPLSGVLGRKKILDIFNAGDMSSTHSANPLCCAAGLAVIEEIENESLIFESKDKGELLKDKLQLMMDCYPKIIKEINCTGLLASIIFKNKKIATKICLKALNKGLLLVHTGRESIKIGPPLVIKRNNLVKGLAILEKVISGL